MSSKTVQAAQRLLAEREAVGLKKYGTTVDRTDLQAPDWLQHAIEEASDLLLYLIRLQQTMQPAPAAAHEGAYGSDATDALQAAREEASAQHHKYMAGLLKFGTIESDPEDAEHAAYLERWKGAPEWAQWLSQDLDGRCDWWEVRPALYENREWLSGSGEPRHANRKTDGNLLGSVRCEPRPEVRP